MKIRLRIYNLHDFLKLVSGMIFPYHIPGQKFSLNKKAYHVIKAAQEKENLQAGF